MQRLKRICSYPGCHRAVRARYCDDHASESQRPRDVRRATNTQRGYDAAWRKKRAEYIKAHPLCEDCLEIGKVNGRNIEVDHIIPIEVRPDLRLEDSNLRSRCRRHHKLKTDQDKLLYDTNRVHIVQQ
jgi:5-methylcytosine-specific restriction endonuclease McrA